LPDRANRAIIRLLPDNQEYKAMPVSPPPEPHTLTAWKARLRAAQEIARRSFEESGRTDDELAEDIEAEVKAHRAEKVGAGKTSV
jgi:hypothetical protein